MVMLKLFMDTNELVIVQSKKDAVESIKDRVSHHWNHLLRELKESCSIKKSLSSGLVTLCDELLKQKNTLHAVQKHDNGFVQPRENKEIAELRTAIQHQRRLIHELQETASVLQRDINDIQDVKCNAETIGLRQQAGLQLLLQQEDMLKDECRTYRRQLAMHRQKTWYEQSVPYPTEKEATSVAKKTSATAPLTAQCQAWTAESTVSQKTINSNKPHKDVDNIPQFAIAKHQWPSPKKKRFKFERKGANCNPVAVTTFSAASCISSQSAVSSKNTPSMEDRFNWSMEDDDLPDLCQGGGHMVTVLPAIGANTYSRQNMLSMFASNAEEETNPSIESLGAKKEANNKHFKFFSNFT